MYNGIGIPTPRGSGTSGYVVTNRAHVKAYGRYPMDSHVYGHPAKKLRKANTELVLHEKKRDIERQLLEYRSSLESKGVYTREQVDEMINNSRERRFKALEMDMVDRSHFRDRARIREDREKYGRQGNRSFQKPKLKEEEEKGEEFTYYGRSANTSDRKSHSSREAQDRKNRVMARALGINQRSHVVGESFHQIGDHDKREESEEEEEKEGRKRKRFERSNRSPSPEVEEGRRKSPREIDEEDDEKPRKKQKIDHVYRYHSQKVQHKGSPHGDRDEGGDHEEDGKYSRNRRPRVTDAERRERKREIEKEENYRHEDRRRRSGGGRRDRYDEDDYFEDRRGRRGGRGRRYEDDYDYDRRRRRRRSYDEDDNDNNIDDRRRIRKRRSESPEKKKVENEEEKKDEKKDEK